jgi:Flp pilus assembly protein TadG
MVTRNFLRDESGATAIVIGLSMTGLLGFAGMAVDVGVWYADKRAAQGAADSAAYSAVVNYGAGDTTTAGADNTAEAVAAQYGYTDGAGGVTVTVNTPPTSGTHTTIPGATEVIVTKSESLLFSKFFVSSTSVSARAVAVPGSSGAYCVLALDTSASTTVSSSDVGLSGTTIIDTTNCGVAINASGSDALYLSGSSELKAKTLSIVGNYTTTGTASVVVTGTKTTNASPVSDPYANVATPSPSGTCAPVNSWNHSASVTISQGTYCNGFSVSGNATVSMNPGTYIIDQGTFNVSNGAALTGTGVTIVLTSSTGSNYATTNISGNGQVNLTAPTSGATSGIVFLQDRRDTSGATSTIANSAGLLITGALYFPTQTLSFTGATSNATQCTQLIAFRITYGGSATFNNNCAGVGVAGIGSSNAALVE